MADEADESDKLRASDSDRQLVADQLRLAVEEGRLSLSEYDERLKGAYAAKTYGDLKAALSQLPSAPPVPRPHVQPIAAKRRSPGGATVAWIAAMWSGWLSTGLIVTAIWFVTSVASDHLRYFWPIWVIGPWGAILLASTVGVLMSGEPGRQERRHARREDVRRERALDHERRDHRSAAE